MPSLFDNTSPANTEAVKLGAQRIRDIKTTLNATLGLIFDSTLAFIAGAIPGTSIQIGTLPGSALTAGGIGATQLGPGAVTPPAFTPGAYSFIASVTAGTTYGLTLSPALPAYVTGTQICFLADSTNAGAVTVNVNGLGAKAIVKAANAALAGGEIQNGAIVWLVYDGTNFQLDTMTQANASAADVVTGTNTTRVVVPASLGPLRFTSGLFALPGSTVGGTVIANTAHGLAGLPRRVRWVLVNQTAEFGYAQNDEVDIATINTDPSSNFYPSFTWGASATNVWLLVNGTVSPPGILNKATAATVSLTLANWKAKCYADLA